VLPERTLERGDDVPAAIRLAGGGQAANVAVWARALGAEARLIAMRGADAAGELGAEMLAARGVRLCGPPARGSNGVVLSLVEPNGERSLASDRGVAPSLDPGEVEPAWLDGCDVLYVSGYSLLAAPICDAAALAAGGARSRVAVDLASASAIEQLGAETYRTRLERLAPEVVFGSGRELEVLGSTPAAELVVKREGSIEVGGRRHAWLPAAAVDTTGAGDALAAGYLVGGVDAALEAAARCVERIGAWP